MKFKVGDKVKVNDPGLAMLRKFMPDGPPNHHGEVLEIWDDGDTLLIDFPIGDDNPEEHSQAAPYPANMVEQR
jgi:hypothetical protein